LLPVPNYADLAQVATAAVAAEHLYDVYLKERAGEEKGR
jgi:hypothetical protein